MPTEVKRIDELFDGAAALHRMQRMIHCAALDAEALRSRFSSEIYIDAATVLLLTHGALTCEINRCTEETCADCVIVLSSSHLFRMEACTDDCRAMCLMVGEDFMYRMDSVDMIYRRIRYGVKLYARPVITLAHVETERIKNRLTELAQAIDGVNHLYYKEVVLNRLFGFYLDLSDVIDRRDGFAPSEQSSRRESIVKRFVELLTANYRTQHKVDFYASQLNLSAHYLTLIVKEVTGRSVSDFIYWMLYSDARALLDDSMLSVQEITALLNFSDQSAFGKFFHRRSGLSPLDYRRRM